MTLSKFFLLYLVHLSFAALYYFLAYTKIIELTSLSVIIVVPFTLGLLFNFLNSRLVGQKFNSLYLVLVLLSSTLVGLSILYAAGLEALLCLTIAFPFTMILPVLGFFVGRLLLKLLLKFLKREHLLGWMLLVASLPLLTDALEKNFPPPEAIETVRDEIVFDSGVKSETIWQRIVSVEAIDSESISEKWIYGLGFPKPVSAIINREGIGAIRIAKFEKKVSFFEEVFEWNPPKKIRFTIYADPAFVPASAFDQHIVIGSRLFDVLDGGYEIFEKENQTILRLTSRHRISTWYNAYTRLWTRAIMHSMQRSILEVLEKRIHHDHYLANHLK